MQIRDVKSLGPAAPVARRERTAASPASSGAGTAAAVVTVALAGIPDAELSPKVRGAILNLMAEVQSLRKELEDSRARVKYLERLADQDPLIPVANRRAFVGELTRMISFSNRYGAPSSVIYFDINGMKKINDEHGHAAGDAALQHVARLLIDNVRTSDFVGRLGGDEFGVVLAQVDHDTAAKKGASLAQTINDTPFTFQGHELRVTAAYGLYSFTGNEDPIGALDAADRAMYENKRQSGAGR